ncbi:hypothetical protein O1611_g1703 [Lasiodiplodia mahajangana]|uniref:Uncharacterized protein n=1 Tax=Lasiodiplodia mahajangana TaxID=1108764 RepID=A0ACC2JX22_9PEZI|nr:hypothetical protein O1611_g1703 [Lasiodiplodia mahajangana]
MAFQANQTTLALLDGPALRPPPGVVPNFDHPWNLNPVGELTNALCLIVTVVVVTIRVYAISVCTKKIMLEDVFMVIALANYLACIWCAYHIIHTTGAFTHQWNIRLEDLSETLYLLHIGFNLATIALGLSKAAIITEWSRIFVPRGTRCGFYWACKVLLAVIFLSQAAFIVTENLSCTPHQKIWDKTIQEGYCISERIFHVPAVYLNVGIILIILILPQKTIWELKTTLKKRIGISLIFLVGILALISAIARAVATVTFVNSDDKTFTISAVYLWVLAEMTCTLLAFCAPTIPKAYANRDKIVKFMSRLMMRVGLCKESPIPGAEARSCPSAIPLSESQNTTNTDCVDKATIPIYRGFGSFRKPRREQTRDGVPKDAILVTTSVTTKITTGDGTQNRHSALGHSWTMPKYSKGRERNSFR